MSEDQNKTVVVDESAIDEQEGSAFFDDLEIEELGPVDDTGKTPDQILAEAGVTKEELDRTFPPDHVPLQTRPSELNREELKQRLKESFARQKNMRAQNEEKVKMPDSSEINRKYAEEAPENIRMTENGPSFDFDDFLGLLEKSKEADRKQQVSDNTRRIVLDEVKRTIGELVENSELETFNAQVARKLYLDRIKAHSRLTELLKYIRICAKKGMFEVQVHYLGQYDRIKLTELGFTITNKSGGRVLAYMISWDDGARQ